MAPTPRLKLDEGFVAGRSCAICGATALKVGHAKPYPDFVTCQVCGSAFVVEVDGRRVLYGSIPARYPSARRFALRQWVAPEEVARVAEPERKGVPIRDEPESQPQASAGVPVSPEAGPAPEPELIRLDYVSRPVEPVIEEAEVEAPSPEPVAEPDFEAPRLTPAPAPQPGTPSISEPAPGQRHRVTIRGGPPRFPRGICAHCLRSPATGRLVIPASTPRGQAVGQRRPVRLVLPLCHRCQQRASARLPEETTARLQAHLVSALIALGLLVAALTVVNLKASIPLTALILTVVTALGYAVPAVILLARTNRYPLPPDAVYVNTTLLVPPDSQGLETAYEFRSQGFAGLFFEANAGRALGGVISVKDRTSQPASGT